LIDFYNYETTKSLPNKSLFRIKKYKSYKGELGKIVANVLERYFKATASN